MMVTVFAGDPPSSEHGQLARGFHDECGLGDAAVAVRRTEDETAARLLDVEAWRLGLPDAIYRLHGNSPVYGARAELFAEPAKHDDHLCSEAEGLILGHLPDIEAMVIPLAVGGHVDHILTRRIGERLVAARRPPAVAWYEESLYEGQQGEAAWARVDTTALVACEQRLTGDQFALKVMAVEAYGSQLRMLTTGPEYAEDRAALFDRLRIERLWFSDGGRRAGGL